MPNKHDIFVVQKNATIGSPSLYGIQKMTTVLRILAYGMPAHSIDEYVKIDKSTIIKLIKKYCTRVVHIFEPQYLRSHCRELQCAFHCCGYWLRYGHISAFIWAYGYTY